VKFIFYEKDPDPLFRLGLLHFLDLPHKSQEVTAWIRLDTAPCV